MELRFSKYQGIGNDFIIFEESEVVDLDFSLLAQNVCNRKFGIGADGMIICRREPNIEMVFYNADGSRAPMCGNGIRCFGHYLKQSGLDGQEVDIKTLAGNLTLEYRNADGSSSRVYMGNPKWDVKEIPAKVAKSDMDKILRFKQILFDEDIELNSLYMGTTHTIVEVSQIDESYASQFGPAIENLDIYPEKTNVNFVNWVDEEHLEILTWERGVGITLACGTGACAAVVVGDVLSKNGKKAEVKSKGGTLLIEIDGKEVYMTGPSQKICSGLYTYIKGGY
ncbi:MAG: diaminopimelate epimerase [Tissierellales bacterium]|jgi:diaminopimelate epimerase|nr:diaminopimelate epimerase [Tissierellales bacterium]